MSRLPLYLTHLSDNHGEFPILPRNSSLVVHSGDLMPNPPDKVRGVYPGHTYIHPGPEEQLSAQKNWAIRKSRKFMGWLKDKTFLFCHGNHDYFDLVPHLQQLGINAIDINDKYVKINGYSFYGFPWVPDNCLPWNYCIGVPEMQKKFDHAASIIEEHGGVDVFVAHCPPAGILDKSFGNRFGNSPFNDFLNYKLSAPPKMVLCGHIHENHGVSSVFNTVISNAATTVHQLEIHDR